MTQNPNYYNLQALPEQKRIAAILDTADALRVKRRESIAQLDALLQSTFLEMFGDPVENPKGWRQDQLGKVCFGKPQYGSGAATSEYDPGLPRYVRITDVDDAGDLSADPRSAVLSEADYRKYRLQEGDVLFARTGATVGKTYRYDPSHGDCVYAGYLIRFQPDPKILLSRILFRLTKTSAYWGWVKNQARVVAQPNINAKLYSELPVIIPPMLLQKKFSEYERRVEAQLAKSRLHLKELDSLFSSLQSRAFNGEL